MSTKAERLRAKILRLTAEYYTEAFPPRDFIPVKIRTNFRQSLRCQRDPIPGGFVARFLVDYGTLLGAV